MKKKRNSTDATLNSAGNENTSVWSSVCSPFARFTSRNTRTTRNTLKIAR